MVLGGLLRFDLRPDFVMQLGHFTQISIEFEPFQYLRWRVDVWVIPNLWTEKRQGSFVGRRGG